MAKETSSAKISVEWGYLTHTIILTPRNWARVKRGHRLTIRSRGFSEEGFQWEYWGFSGGLEGDLIVGYGNDGGTGFIGKLSDAHIEEIASPTMVEQVTDFRKGDRGKFRCRATVIRTMPSSVVIALDELHEVRDIHVPPNKLTNISKPRITLEEAMELDIGQKLVKAVERSICKTLDEDDGTIEEIASAAIDGVYGYHIPDKIPEDFEIGDRVEFKCIATVMGTTPPSIIIALDSLAYVPSIPDLTVPRKMFTSFLAPRETTLEESFEEYGFDDELYETIERAIRPMFGTDGLLDEPVKKVAAAAIDAVYGFHRQYYGRPSTKLRPSGAAD